MPRGYASLAEYYRAHREEMELARATGCTPLEARRELRRPAQARRARCGQMAPTGSFDHDRRFANDDVDRPVPGTRFGDWESPWMMRD